MRVESFEKHMNRTCRRCYTFFGPKLDFCCIKNRKECYADIGLVRKGMYFDSKLRSRLYKKKKIDINSNIINRRFFRGWLRKECLVKGYRPPWCRSYYCRRWDRYIEENPQDFIDANTHVVSAATLRKALKREYEYGVKFAYPGGFIIFAEDLDKTRKGLKGLFDGMRIKYFFTDIDDIDPKRNEKEGVEIIIDKDGVVGKPGFMGAKIRNNMFMLFNMKMNMGKTGSGHSNVLVTTAFPEDLSGETPASLRAFHGIKAFRL
jgi:hypothetical protein